MRKSIITLLIIILIVASFVVYSLVNNSNETNNNITTIRLNEVTRSVFYAPQYVAISNGYFKDENIEIELTTGQGADKVMTAVLARSK